MSENAAAATSVAPAPSTSSAPTRGGRGEGRGRGLGDRGGRGRGRGFGDGARGRGGDRGGRGGGRGCRGGRGGDRGRGRGEGGRGRGEGGRTHRSRTGKKRSRDDLTANKDNRFYEDGTPVDPEAPQSPATQRSKKEKGNKKTTSDFELLRTAFTDAAAIAEFIRDHGEKRLTDAKQMNMFLQAVSSREEGLYNGLINGFKPQVVVVLERMYGIYSSAGTAMPPCAHEFVIRCEQQGVRKLSWSGDLPVKDGDAAALLTPRDLLKRLMGLHPVGRLQRLIELSTDVDDMARCVSKALALFAPSAHADSTADKAADGDADEAPVKPVDYASKCQLISKLASKARRVVTVPTAKPVVAAAVITTTTTTPAVPAADTTTPADDATLEDAPTTDVAVEEPVDTPTVVAEEADAEDKAEAAKGTVLRDLTDEEREGFRQIVTELLGMLRQTLAERPPTTTLKPTGKMIHFAGWCRANDLLHKADEAIVDTLGAEVEEDLAATAAQLESVIMLKELAPGDAEALRAAVDELWKTGGGTHLAPYSADVLSAVATAASAEGISDELRKLVADRLVETLEALEGEGLQLPRRALRLVNNEKNKVKQAALAQQLEEERAARDDVMARAAERRAKENEEDDSDAEDSADEKVAEDEEDAEPLTNLLDRETDSDDDN